MTKCKKVGPKTGAGCSLDRYHDADEHEARGPRGAVLERWPKRRMGKKPKPVGKLRLAADGTPEIKLSGIPLPTLEAIEAHAKAHPLRYRGRNALLALCALAGWEALQKKDARRERSA
jgi:hypothetical protein